MSPLQQSRNDHDDPQAVRTHQARERLEVDLHRAAGGFVDPEWRELVAQAADVLGLDVAARRARERNARAIRAPAPQLREVPPDARRPLKRTPDRALLLEVPPNARAEPDPASARRVAYATLVGVYDQLAATPGLDDDDRASLVRQRQAAARVAGLPPLAPARGLHGPRHP